ncbi:MAG: hypothetical protein LBM23_07750 [Propionibacteriaceae bacterium]|nr:hypothetical protein [Propionibacteriaceae bacterium]
MTLAVAIAACSAEPPSSEPTETVHAAVDWAFQTSFEELVEASKAIVTGEVVSSEVRRIGNDGGSQWDVYTVHSVRVAQSIKGAAAPGDLVEVAEMGGAYDRVLYLANEGLLLENGNDYLLFTMDMQEGLSQLVSGPQGAYRILSDGTLEPLMTPTIIDIDELEALLHQ